MNTREVRALGERITRLIQERRPDEAQNLLTPVLMARTPFAKLGLIGAAIGAGEPRLTHKFLARIAQGKTEGGWVVIGHALGEQLDSDLEATFEHCRQYILAADTWYGADILGERVPGPALVTGFDPALEALASWRVDPNHWVRRSVGVAVHFWAKRSRGSPELGHQAEYLLDFLTPMFSEWKMEAVKGIAWGLKTLGKHYPELVTPWLICQVSAHASRYRALMLRKAITYLDEGQRAEIIAASTR